MLLEKIKNNDFAIELDGDDFTVSPREKLTAEQREFLKANKPQIMRELLLTTVYNLNGVPMQIQAKNAEHKAWLIKVNHSSTTPVVFND
jgi:carbamoylphosphate synthase large subunit